MADSERNPSDRVEVELDLGDYIATALSVTITDARGRLSALIEEAQRAHEPVYLTRRGRAVAAIVGTGQLRQLIEDAEELADIRAVDAAGDETERLGETSVPWDEVKGDLGLE